MATPTGKLIRNPQVINAMGTSTIAAPSQQAVSTAVADAKKAGTDAQSAANSAKSTADTAIKNAATADGKAVAAQNTANTANNTANAAKSAAATAQSTADAAKSAAATADSKAVTADGKAVAAQTAANNANNNANGRVPTSRKINGMDLTADRTLTASHVGALTQSDADARYQLKGAASGITLGGIERVTGNNPLEWKAGTVGEAALTVTLMSGAAPTNSTSEERSLPANSVLCNIGHTSGNATRAKPFIEYRRITGGI